MQLQYVTVFVIFPHLSILPVLIIHPLIFNPTKFIH